MRVSNFVNGQRYAVGSLVIQNGRLALCVGDDNAGHNFWRFLDVKITVNITVNIDIPEYSEDNEYKKGDLAMSDNMLIVANVDISSGTPWDADDWILLVNFKTLGSEVRYFTADEFDKNNWIPQDIIVRDGKLYKCTANYNSDDYWQPSDAVYWDNLHEIPTKIYPFIKHYPYREGDLVYTGGKFYVCILPHEPEDDLDEEKFVPCIFKYFNFLPYNHYRPGNTAVVGDKFYVCTLAHDSGDELEPAFFVLLADIIADAITKPTKRIYRRLGDVIVKNRKIYVITETHIAPDNDFDSDKSEEIGSYPLYLFMVRRNVLYPKNYIVRYGDTISYPNQKIYTSNISKDTFPTLFENVKEWQPDTEYKAGYIVIYDGKLYVCTTDHTSGDEFDPDKWSLIGYVNKITKPVVEARSSILLTLTKPIYTRKWKTNEPYTVSDIVYYNGTLYRIVTPHTSGNNFSDNVDKVEPLIVDTPVFEPNHDYVLNDIILEGNVWYVRKTPHTSGSEFNSSKWEPYTTLVKRPVTTEDSTFEPNKEYKKGDYIVHLGKFYVTTKDHTSADTFDNDSSNWKEYKNVGLEPLDDDAVYVLKYANNVINSAKEYNEGLFPDATWKNIWPENLPEDKDNTYVHYKIYRYDPQNDFDTGVNVGYKDRIYNFNFTPVTSNGQTTLSGEPYFTIPLENGVYELVPIENIKKWIPKARYFPSDVVWHNDGLYRVIQGHDSTDDVNDSLPYFRLIFPVKAWTPRTYYNVGDWLLWGGLLLLCLLAHLAGDDIDFSKFKVISVRVTPSRFTRPNTTFSNHSTSAGTARQDGYTFGPDGTLLNSNTSVGTGTDGTYDYPKQSFETLVM